MSRHITNPFTDGVNLNPDAWYMRLMQWCWGTQPSEFKNLCPLFWSVIGTLLALPLLLIVALFDNLTTRYEIWRKFGKFINLSAKWFLLTCGTFIATVLISIIMSLLLANHTESTLISMAIIVGFALLIAGILAYMDKYSEKEEDGEIEHCNKLAKAPYYFIKGIGKPFNFIGYYIKAAYHKCCPMVNWIKKS